MIECTLIGVAGCWQMSLAVTVGYDRIAARSVHLTVVDAQPR